ncbi:MAG: ATPase [Heliobacteriaceae bacterium]|nr:ATPase [Heliobacteriaceae bacterium]MDD4587002.1 ATPase [Heliobacteriaceae bacterium]
MERALALEGNDLRGGEGKVNVLRLLDEIEELIESAARIPMTGKILIDDDLLLDYLDRIRTGLPEELRQAKWLTKERQRVIQEAEGEAKRMIEETKAYVAKMAGETEICREARLQAEEIVAQSKREATELKAGACEYADDILRQLEHTLGRTVNSVRKGREELQNQQERAILD